MMRAIFSAAVFAAVLLAGGWSASNAQTPPPHPTPWPSLSPIPPMPTPIPTPTPLTTPSPSPSPSPTPKPSPSPSPTPLVLSPDAAPQIVDLQLSSTVLHGGDTFSGTAITSTNVASLEVRIASYSFSVPRTDFGIFAMNAQVPRVPFYARHKWTAHVIARNAAGVEVTRDIAVTLR